VTSKQRVLTSLSFREPDRVPIDYWGTPETTRMLVKHFAVDTYEALLQKLDVDLRIIPGPKYVGPELTKHPDGSREDYWGVPRVEKTYGEGPKRGTYHEVTRFPLGHMTTVQEIDRHRWPTPDWFDYSDIAAQCAQFPDKAVVSVGDRLDRTALLKPAMYLRGTEQIFLDLVENPAIAEAVFEHIAAFYLEHNRRIFEAASGKLDIFMMGDDFGMQHGLLCSYDTWKRFFAPGLRRYIALPKRYGLKVMHHSCGAIRPIIADLIDMGLDILNPIQPGCVGMDPHELKRDFGKPLAFHGSINIQQTLPFGTIADVRAEVRDRMAALAPGGGFLICTAHNIQVDTPLPNILALFDAYHEFGRYPIARG